uniref:Gnk2-homologous domain-containing protein n=1 Tax=Caenorhabditis tropicalis TaxID=1561998 RepID=A0A1I7UK33_9PELO
MKTFAMICLLLLLVPLSSSTQFPYFVGNLPKETREICMEYYKSSSAKLKEENIIGGVVNGAMHGFNDPDYENAIRSLAEEKYADHICDPTEFEPIVKAIDKNVNCATICDNCMPGSVPICFLRSPRYAGLAQVCLCTYSLHDPVEEAAFSIRHEKRVFSRKIRRT